MWLDRAMRLAGDFIEENPVINHPLAKNPLLRRAAVAVAGKALGKIAPAKKRGRRAAHLPARAEASASRLSKQAAVKAAHRLNRSAATLAASVLFDSAVEHYRGSFHNKAMFTPLVASSLSILSSMHGTSDHTTAAHRLRHAIAAIAAGTGFVGTGFHIYNVRKRPGGFSWQNLFYQAPLGAPAAIGLSGLMGVLAEVVRDTPPGRDPHVLGFTAGRFVGLATAISLLGTTSEAGLLHFRGAFHNPMMYTPVVLPPIGAVLLANAALGQADHPRPVTRAWLGMLAVMGVAGVGFHVYGVSRNMDGWRNWRQNLLNGPPIPAPPSFTGLALAGLAALGLLRDHPDD